jgi:hypothetical protein
LWRLIAAEYFGGGPAQGPQPIQVFRDEPVAKSEPCRLMHVPGLTSQEPLGHWKCLQLFERSLSVCRRNPQEMGKYRSIEPMRYRGSLQRIPQAVPARVSGEVGGERDQLL